jgi:starch synthase
MKKLNIAYIASEVTPYSKTGGLADVAGALPQELAALKNKVVLFSPRYSSVDRKKFDLVDVKGMESLAVAVAGREYKFSVAKSGAKTPGLETYFIDNAELFGRNGLYQDPVTVKDYPDNDIRFVMFAKAVLLSLEKLGFQPDIVHANDWQTSLVIAYLKTIMKSNPFFQNTKTALTIHNVAYQGLFPAERFDVLGLDRSLLYPMSPFEYWGKVNLLKAGILYADVVNTVSKTYAEEIQTTDEYGYGLEGVLRDRKRDLFGVVNGVDYDIWSPENDKLIAKKFDVETLAGKPANKKKLLDVSGLGKDRADKPLIGIISRMAPQKGFDLIEEVAEQLFDLDFTLVLLGTGDKVYHKLFEELQTKHPDRIKVNLTFDNTLAHLIEAGADMFLMPSRYEPCGLNQLYSLRYGTVPLARKTGGLADTIIDETTNKGKGTGFLFEEYTGEALLDCVERALSFYRNKRSWNSLMKRGMKKDFSWKKSAKEYLALYARALEGLA